MKDPIVEEVRKNRMEHTRKFNGSAFDCGRVWQVRDGLARRLWIGWIPDVNHDLSMRTSLLR